MKITKEFYATMPDGKEVNKFTLTNDNGMIVEVIELGCCITKIIVPDKDGNMADVVLGYDNLEGYLNNTTYFGAAVGRNGNRIGYGVAHIDGESYKLEQNDGKHNLHGGSHGFSRRVFGGTPTDDSLQLSATIPHLEDDFPGNLDVTITYSLTDNNRLEIGYHAVSDKDTVINLTNHSYYNLAGHNSGTIAEQILQLNSSLFTVNDDTLLPTGELTSVSGTPFDFRKGADLYASVLSDFPYIKMFGGLDHNMVIDGSGYQHIGSLSHPASGRIMRIYTSEPCMQIYTANMVDPQENGKDGATYGKYTGVCFETQNFPNAVNMPWMKSPIYKKGEVYSSKSAYEFDILD